MTNFILMETTDVGLEMLTQKKADGVKIWKETYKLIPCDLIQIVSLGTVGGVDGVEMLIDEEGLLKNRPIVNHVASALFRKYAYGDMICGSAVIAKYNEDKDEYEGFTDEEMGKLLTEINRTYYAR